MKLFFSYGHDKNEKIVLRLKSDLEKRNHTIWIDKSQIKVGDDWRRSIITGIVDSDFVISFASNHSVRNPGVCLDELMIAVSVKGARIQTILLESDVVPPANIGYRQYIDMSNWRTLRDTDEFEFWYASKLNDIIRIIEDPETARYVEELEYLKDQLHPDLSSAKMDRLQQEFFCGREWLSKRISKWLSDSSAPRILLIDGSPGIGKSSFMAHEFIFNAAVGAILFCEWDNPAFNNLDAISRYIVFQLASKITDYRHQVVRYLRNVQQLDHLFDKSREGEGIFRFLLIQQLRNLIDGERPTVLILIDGIDELNQRITSVRRRNVFAELLQKEILCFPRWVRFVVTSRCDSRVTVPLQNTAVIHMEESVTDNTRDIIQYLKHELEDNYSPEIIAQLSEKCDGNFLYAKMVTNAIKSNKMSVNDVFVGNTGDLNFVYRHYFDRIFYEMDEYEELYYPAIAALAVTEERIPDSTFRKITRWPKKKYLQYMKVMSPLLSQGREYVGFYHKSIQDWLLSETADDYMVDDEEGNKVIAKACMQTYEEDMSEMNDYELNHLIPCLEKTHDQKLRDITGNIDYGELLLHRARNRASVFCYEDALIQGEMAWRIFNNKNMYEEAATTGLFLAEINDLRVELHDSEKWCHEALSVTKQDSKLEKSILSGDIWMRLAYVYFRRGKWAKSSSAYKTAYEHYDQCEIIKDRERERKKVEALMMSANALRNATDYVESINVFNAIEALPEYKSIKKSKDALYVNILMYHGWALHSAGRYKEAGKFLEYAEKICGSVSLPLKDIAQIYYLRAVETFNKTDYLLAERYCEKSLCYVKQAYGENSVEICSVLNQMGAIAVKQNNLVKAIQTFGKSYEIRKNYYGENNLFTTISLRNYAKVLLRQGNNENLKNAGSILEKVKIIREKIVESGKGLGWLAQIYLDLADYNNKIHCYKEAEIYVSKAMTLYEKQDSYRDLCTCEMQMGIIKYEEGCYSHSRIAFERALGLCKNCYNAEHPYSKELETWLKKVDDRMRTSAG